MELVNYRAAAKTYRKPLILLTAFPVAIWIVTLVIARQMQELPSGATLNAPEHVLLETQSVNRQIALTVLFIPSATLLIWVGAVLSMHLKEMLGNPRSRLVPNLQRTHLALAALITAIFTVLAPFAAASYLDLGLPTAAVVACCLTFFTASACIVHWLPFALPPVIGFSALLFCLTFGNHGSSWSLNATTTWAFFLVSVGGLVSIGLRLAHLHEGMFEYHRRFQAQPWGSRGFLEFFPSKSVRLGKRPDLPASDTLLGRALRWHAAWRTMWVAIASGLLTGGIFGCMALFKGLSIREFAGSPTVAFYAVFPVITLASQSRRFLIEELVRPASRRDYVRAVGLAMIAAALVAWLAIQAVGLLLLLIGHRSGIAWDGLGASVAFSLCCLPVLFGVAVWPYRTLLVFMAYSALLGVMGSFVLMPLKLSGLELIGAGSSLLVVGLALTRASYLRWLNQEVAPAPPLFGGR